MAKAKSKSEAQTEAQATSKVTLQFNANMTPYVKGDICGLTAKEAKPYIKAGVAEVLKGEVSVDDETEDGDEDDDA